MNKRIKTLKIALARLGKFAEKLEDIADWETGNAEPYSEEDEIRGKDSPRGIGWRMSREDVNAAKWIMEESPGHWVFIVPDDTSNIEEKVKSEEFRRWLEEKGYGEDYSILVVGSNPLVGDFKDPQWIVHDLVGHAISISLSNVLKAYDIYPMGWSMRKDIGKMADEVSKIIPDHLQIASVSSDKLMDINIAIAFGLLDLEDALAVIRNIDGFDTKDLERNMKVMFINAEKWLRELTWIPVGKNKVSIIYSW